MPTRLKLCDLKTGCCGKVCDIPESCPLRDRLLDLGVYPGCKVVLERRAPLGGPLAVTVCGKKLSLREGEAAWVEVEAT
jgi:Fe2+ transport system protein FeoA